VLSLRRNPASCCVAPTQSCADCPQAPAASLSFVVLKHVDAFSPHLGFTAASVVHSRTAVRERCRQDPLVAAAATMVVAGTVASNELVLLQVS